MNNLTYTTTKKVSGYDAIALVFFTIYLTIPFTYSFNYQDFAGVHWLALSIVNLAVSGYLIFTKDNDTVNKISSFFKSKTYLIYSGFVLISGISIAVALNKTEALVQYARLINIFISFILLGILFINKKHLFPQIAVIITALTFLESYLVIQEFYKNDKNLDLSQLILKTLKSTTGNKNIFSATLVIKLSFILYTFIKKSGFWKYFALVTLFLTVHIVYLSITRTAFVGVILVFATYFIGSLIIKKVDDKSTIVNTIIAIIVFVGASYTGQLKIDKNYAKDLVKKGIIENTESKNKAQVISRLEDSERDIRFKYWEETFKIIQQNPTLGVGYGNFKLYTPTYEKGLIGDKTFTKHPHNDFIFVAAESGYLAAFIYILVFFVTCIILILGIFKAATQNEKLINLTLLTSLGICILDALFNFPKERFVTQLLLIIIFVLAISNNNKLILKDDFSIDSKKLNITKILASFLFILSGFIAYSNNEILKSMRIQSLADVDYFVTLPTKKTLKHTYEEMKSKLPSYPNISESYEPIHGKLAKYLRLEKKYDQAIDHWKITEAYHPYYAERNFEIANIYYHDLKNYDSAYVYINKSLNDKPKNYDCLKMATYLMSLKQEHNKIKKAFAEFYKYNPENQLNYSFYCQVLYSAKLPDKELDIIVKKGLEKYPKDKKLNELSEYFDDIFIKNNQ